MIRPSVLRARGLNGSSVSTFARSPHIPFRGVKNFATTPPKLNARNYKWLKVIGVIGGGGVVLYSTSDTAKHLILTARRVGIVASATTKCVILYRKVIQGEYESKEQRLAAFSKTHKKAAEITLKALEANGGIYIKLGQHILALTYLLPTEWTSTMIPLQDKCPQSALDDIEKMFVTDLGKRLDELFSEFNPDPIGVASLAQVHLATLRATGEQVAVKIQHPTLQEFVPLDVYLTRTIFSLLKVAFPEYPLTWLGDEMENSIYVELNFVLEAQNSERTAQYFKSKSKNTALRVPKVISAARRILIMECISGARLDNLEFLAKNNINTGEVASCLSHIFNNMIFVPGVGLHCDPHGGNLAIRPVNGKYHNFEIILYDHGLYRDIPLQIKRDYSHFWLLILDGDIPKVKEYCQKVTHIESEQKFRIFMSAITGRAPDKALNADVSRTRRLKEEIMHIQEQFHATVVGGGSVLEDLMDILSSIPTVVLLILKTNDLTRNLDENLNSPLGPERTFLIMASYCAKVVYDEKVEQLDNLYKGFSLKWTFLYIQNWILYQKRVSSLVIYDFAYSLRNIVYPA